MTQQLLLMLVSLSLLDDDIPFKVTVGMVSSVTGNGIGAKNNGCGGVGIAVHQQRPTGDGEYRDDCDRCTTLVVVTVITNENTTTKLEVVVVVVVEIIIATITAISVAMMIRRRYNNNNNILSRSL
jgi:hypothetical protein